MAHSLSPRTVLTVRCGSEDSSTIPVLESSIQDPLRPGSRQLRHWAIIDSRLQTDGETLFRQPGVWELYRPYILAGVLIVSVQTALIAGLVVQHVRRRRTEVALRQSSEQNQDLAGRLINAQEAERRRIARDLHDDMSQQLAGLAIMLSGLRRKVGRSDSADLDHAVATLQDRASSLAEAVRNLSHELHPSILEHAGLVATLRRHCADVEQLHHVAVTFSAGKHLDSLSPDVALCLFRVTQEVLSNAVRHARAGTIRVRLMAETKTVELSITDDGIGFVTGEHTGLGLGLRSIDERVRLNRGSVTVGSRPGEGTTVQVRIPLSPTRADVVNAT